MKKIFAVAGICALLATPVFAQDKEEEAPATPPTAAEVDAAVKAINDLSSDKAKVASYCELIKEMDSLKEGDDKAAEAFGQKFDTYMSGLSEDAQKAFAISDAVDPASAEGKKLETAFNNFEEGCES